MKIENWIPTHTLLQHILHMSRTAGVSDMEDVGGCSRRGCQYWQIRASKCLWINRKFRSACCCSALLYGNRKQKRSAGTNPNHRQKKWRCKKIPIPKGDIFENYRRHEKKRKDTLSAINPLSIKLNWRRQSNQSSPVFFYCKHLWLVITAVKSHLRYLFLARKICVPLLIRCFLVALPSR